MENGSYVPIKNGNFVFEEQSEEKRKKMYKDILCAEPDIHIAKLEDYFIVSDDGNVLAEKGCKIK